ncbi:MAG: glycosyltransferase, partial [Terriglobales bacterium]
AVDDASTDGSKAILQELAANDSRIKALYQPRNCGKAAAIRRAIASASGEISIIQDADLEYAPEEIPKVVDPILRDLADAVFGSRFAGSECRRVLYYWHSVANKLLTFLTNAVCDLNLTDMETCYKAVRTDILKQLILKAERFGIEPELTIRLAQWGARIYEVPISYSGRTYAEGKKITWKDGLQALSTIVSTAFLDRRFTTHDGFYVLTAVRGPSLNRWMYSQFSRYVGQDVLEAGCGVGNLTTFFLDRERLICADIDRLYVKALSQRFGYLENIATVEMDVSQSENFECFAQKKLDTVICLNVLEHIEDDLGVLKNFYNSLKPGGRAIILVPQHPSLFTPVDVSVGHYRRYTKDQLLQRLTEAGFQLEHVQDFNRLGTIGWWLNGKIMKRDTLSPASMQLFNAALPLAKLMEHFKLMP